MQVGTWLERLRAICRQAPGCRVLLIDEPLDWENSAHYEPEELPVLRVTVDREARDVSLHTESDEDGPFLPPTPMLLTDLLAALDSDAEESFEMFWVSGWIRAPEIEGADPEDEGAAYLRQASLLIGGGHPEDLAQVIFVRQHFPAAEEKAP
jgi:hypothetical protein